MFYSMYEIWKRIKDFKIAGKKQKITIKVEGGIK